MRILIVEDDPTSSKILQLFLEPYGKCDAVTNGKDAIASFCNALDSKAPYDLICLDIMMPEMNGLEALIEIRKIENSRGSFNYDRVKVIITSAREDVATVISAFKLMCEEYLLKPIDRQILIDRIRSLGLIP